MKISKLFHVLVVTGASSTVGLAACSSSDAPTTGGTTAGTGGSGTAGSTSSAGTAGSAGTPATGGGGGIAAGGGGTATGGGGIAAGGSAGAAAGGTSGGSAGGSTGMSGGGGAAACVLTDSPCGFGYKDYGGCCCWIVAPSKGRCTEVGCPANTLCCAGYAAGPH